MSTRPRRSGIGGILIGRLAGIEVRVHPTFALLLLLVALGSGQPGEPGLADALAWLGLVFACVLIHELAHCVVARRYGIGVTSIVLLPIGGVSQLEDMPEDARIEFQVAVAGPLTSLGLGLVAAALASALGLRVWPLTLYAGAWISRLVWLNLILGAFNLLPAFPMDGGRVLRALLERRYDRGTATRLAARTGMALAAVMAAVGLLFNLWLILIAVFIYMGAKAEESAVLVHERFRGHTVGEVMLLDPVTFGPETTAYEAAGLMRHSAQDDFPVVGPDGYIGMVSRRAVGSAPPFAPLQTMTVATPVLAPDEPVDPAGVQALSDARASVPVIRGGRVVGLLRLVDLTNADWTGLAGHEHPTRS